MLTTEAEDSLGHIHDRMPLMVERERWHEWLDPTHAPVTPRLLVPAAPGRLEAYAVPTLVSNVRNNGPELRRAAAPGGRSSERRHRVRTVATPHGEAPAAHRPRRQRRSPRCC